MYTVTWPQYADDEENNLSEFGIVEIGQWIPKVAEHSKEGRAETYFLVLETEEEAALWILTNKDPKNRLAILTDNMEENSGWKELGF